MTLYGVDDRSYIDRRVGAIDASALESPVRDALGDPAASVVDWRFEPVGYDFLNPSSGGVYRFTGSAERTGGSVPWALILKVTRSAASLEHGKPVPADVERTMHEAVRWDRELLAYESGFLESPGGDLAAARCYGWARHSDDTAWLWLEDLGNAFSGDTWPVERRERLERLWADREVLLDAVEAIPPVCSHLDSHRRNLAAGPNGVTAIDWGLVGLAAPGEEIASSLVGTVASGESAAEQTDELAQTLFEGYLAGLRDGGWRGADAAARLGFTAAAGLRVFSVLGFDAEDEDEALPRFATLSHTLLRLGEEARGLL